MWYKNYEIIIIEIKHFKNNNNNNNVIIEIKFYALKGIG